MKIRLEDFLTRDELAKAIMLYNECRADPGTFARRCDAEIIRPVLPRINAALGQANDARYLAYMVEFACMQTERKP